MVVICIEEGGPMSIGRKNIGRFSVIEKATMANILAQPAVKYDAKKEAKKARRQLRKQGLKL